MTDPAPPTVAELSAKAASASAIEALWDGDTHGWYVNLFAVVKSAQRYDTEFLRGFRGAGDIRLFNGQVPPWSEAVEAARIGEQLAALLGVPFHFPSPHHPEEDCPHWWEVGQSRPCRRCGAQLLQAENCAWRGACYSCHLALEREQKEARWSAEERNAPRCRMCGKPAIGATDTEPRCQACCERYRTFVCLDCGQQATVVRKSSTADQCSSCVISKQLSQLPVDERRRLRQIAAHITTNGLFEAGEILSCDFLDVEEILAVLTRTSNEEK